jgi:hypothetical protein
MRAEDRADVSGIQPGWVVNVPMVAILFTIAAHCGARDW